jgi:hypothetical protein
VHADEGIPIGWAIFLEPSVPAFVLASALVAFVAWRLALPARTGRERVLGFGVWAAACVVACTQVLSLVRALHWPGMLILAAAGALAAWRVRPSSPAAGTPVRRDAIPSDERRWLVAFAVPALAYTAWSIGLILASSEPVGDNLGYHIPRLAYWIQHQTLAPFPSNDPRMSTFPVGANVLQLWPALFLKQEGLGALVQLAAHLGAGLCVYGVARDLGAARPAAAAAGFCWLAVPAALRQATTSNVDVIAAFLTIATGALAIGAVRRGRAWLATTCLASAALAVAAKPHTLPFAAACAAVALFVLSRERSGRVLARSALVAVLGVLVVAPPFVQNTLAYGSPSGLASVRWVVVSPGFRTLAKNLQLLLLPLTGGRGFDGAFPAWPFREAAREQGLGLPWLALTMAALSVGVVRAVRSPRRHALPLAYATAGLVYAGTVLFALRHQPSVDRFALPAAAVLTPLLAWVLVGRARVAALAGIWTLGSLALLDWAQLDFDRRRSSFPPPLFGSYGDFPGRRDLSTLARAGDRLAAGGRGRRIGLLTGQGGFFQRLLLGPQFQNALVPLGHDARLEPASADRLRLDALVIDVGADFSLQLFRRQFVPPAAPSAGGWRPTAREFFDDDFLHAHEQGVEYRSFEHVARLFGRAASGWVLDRSVRANTLVFVRGTGRAALALVHTGGESALEEANGLPFYRIGAGAVVLKVFAGADGPARFEARIRRGRDLAGDRAAIELTRAGGRPVRVTAVVGTSEVFPVQLQAGINRFILRVVDAPRRGTPEGARTDQLGLVNLRIRWADED